MLKFVIILLIIGLQLISIVRSEEFLKFKARSGDNLTKLLAKYNLNYDVYLNKFIELNKGKLIRDNELMLDRDYLLPVIIIEFNGINIRATLNIDDIDLATRVMEYNDKLFAKGIKKKSYKEDNKLWIPSVLYKSIDSIKSVQKVEVQENNEIKSKIYNKKDKGIKKKEKTSWNKLLGKKNKNFKILDTLLKEHFIYLDAGHGGPDPGAIGITNNGIELAEDEYAYDITLRLAKKLLQHSATVFMIVQDTVNGIRDDSYLQNNLDEIYYGNDTISTNQKTRLKARADIINTLYKKNKNSARSQLSLTLHVDSRDNDKRIDIFYYYQNNNIESIKLANFIYDNIKMKYDFAQPGRGYNGSVSSRDLFMLREVIPTAVYIELGNIQNKEDQVRFINKNNRQALANWISDSILKFISETNKK